jgi:hypothetical protein
MDWLATELIRLGWDMKALHRAIVTSAVYRQSSRVTPRLREVDPENLLYARAPRFRLPAPVLRDQALAASGLLVERLGGPPVRPYQPEGVWEEATFGQIRYEQDHGEALYRRSLYTFWRRIVGPTNLFDTATRQACTVRQARTNSPLHALVTFNDVTFVEAARALAQRVMRASPGVPDRVIDAFRRVTARRPTPPGLSMLLNRLALLRQHYAAHPDEAAKLLAVGESARDTTLVPAEHAAYASLCSLILNLDETLTRE